MELFKTQYRILKIGQVFVVEYRTVFIGIPLGEWIWAHAGLHESESNARLFIEDQMKEIKSEVVYKSY